MIVERSCIVCKKKTTKENLIKFVFNKNQEIFIEQEKRIDGRGAYICKNLDCIKKCIKTKALNRTFKHNISQEFYEEILNYFGTIKN